MVSSDELQDAPDDIEVSPEYEGFFAEFYDILHSACTADVSMYVDLAKECGGPVLEISYRAERILLPLARAGFSVTGVDLSATCFRSVGASLTMRMSK